MQAQTQTSHTIGTNPSNLTGAAQPPLRQHSSRELQRLRSVLLSYVLKLNRSIDARHADLAQAINRRFVQVLTDYISYGHFRLLNSCHPEAHQIVGLQNNTQFLLAYTESDPTQLPVDLPALKTRLEQLALTLEARFEIEDEIVLGAIWQSTIN